MQLKFFFFSIPLIFKLSMLSLIKLILISLFIVLIFILIFLETYQYYILNNQRKYLSGGFKGDLGKNLGVISSLITIHGLIDKKAAAIQAKELE